MTKNAKDKKSAAATKNNKFVADDKVFAMDGGDLYEAKVSFQILPKVHRLIQDGGPLTQLSNEHKVDQCNHR